MQRRLLLLSVIALVLIALFSALRWMDHKGDGDSPKKHAKHIKKTLPGEGFEPDQTDAPERLAPEFGTIRCSSELGGHLVALNGPQVNSSDGLSLAVPPGVWWVHWERDTHTVDLGKVDVSAGETVDCRLSDTPSRVSGRVQNRRGSPVEGAEVRARCASGEALSTSGGDPGEMITGSDGRFEFDFPASVCNLVATLRTGALSRESDPLEVSLFGRDAPQILILDSRPVAGLGIGLMMVPDGIQVRNLLPGGSAADAGMMEGDLIVEVEGKSTIGMDYNQFKSLATGEEGTRAQLKVMHDGQVHSYSLLRKIVEEEKPALPGPPDAPTVPEEEPPDEGPPDTAQR